MTEFQTIKGVGPYTAAVIASHAVRDPSALGARRVEPQATCPAILGVDDAEPEVVMAEMHRLFPRYEALAGLYVIEYTYREQPVDELV